MAYKYAAKFNKENMARAMGVSLPLSTKQSIEICNFIRGKKVSRAKVMLEDVTKKKIAVPFRRFNGDVGHKPGKIGPGRYPIKACKEFLKLVESAEANAQHKGLSTANLIIVHACAHDAGNQWHYGRWRRRKMKRTHIEIMVQETEDKKTDKKGKKETKANKPKTETKSKVKKEDQPKPAAKTENKPIETKKEKVTTETKKEEASTDEKAVKAEEKKDDNQKKEDEGAK